MKLVGWQHNLRDYLAAQADKPFEWSRNDCGAFAGGAVEAMTGVNPHAKVAGKYKTAKGAALALKRLGFGDHIAYAASVMTEIDPAYAGFGDIAVVPGDGGMALGVVTGTHVEVRAPAGRAVIPLADAVRAFRA